VLVIGADALSRITDWRDRGTCILFGDGCGAVVLTAADVAPPLPPASPAAAGAGATPSSSSSSSDHDSTTGTPSSSSSSQHHHLQIGTDRCAILGVDMHSDGAGHKSLNAVYAGSGGKPYQEGEAPSAAAAYSNIAMAGQEVFKFAVRSVPAVSGACWGTGGCGVLVGRFWDVFWSNTEGGREREGGAAKGQGLHQKEGNQAASSMSRQHCHGGAGGIQVCCALRPCGERHVFGGEGDSWRRARWLPLSSRMRMLAAGLQGLFQRSLCRLGLAHNQQ
jgi:hypothetical protein